MFTCLGSQKDVRQYITGVISFVKEYKMPQSVCTLLRILKGCPGKYTIFLFWILQVIVNFLPTMLKSGIASGVYYCIVLYVIIENVGPSFNYLYNNNIEDMRRHIEKSFMRDGFSKYKKMSHESKCNKPVEEFKRKLNNAGNSLITIYGWGFSQILGLISAVIGCLFVFIQNKLYYVGLLTIAFNIVSYFLISKKLQKEYTDCKKQTRDEQDRANCDIALSLPLFQYNEKTVDEMMDMETIIQNGYAKNSLIWNKITLVTNTTNALCLLPLWMIYDGDVVKFILLLDAFNQLNQAVHHLMNFMNQFSRIDGEYNNYEEVWKDAVFEEEPKKLQMTDTKVTGINLKLGGLTFKLGNQLTIKQGQRILIKGPSGHGKTTFLNALIGKIAGLDLEFGMPKNFTHQFVEFFQNIKELMPTSKITVRRLFSGEKDDELIMLCCRLSKVDDWVVKLKLADKKFQKKDDKKDDNKDVMAIELSSKQNYLDIEINNKISGGQKSRLALATRLYKVIKEKKKVLVLDEPEQGSDAPLAYEMLDGIFKYFEEHPFEEWSEQMALLKKQFKVTVITVTHLEKARERYRWDNVLDVLNGNIGS